MDRAEKSLLTQMEAAERYAATVRGKWFLSAAEESVLKNIADERKRFDTWRTTWRQWALSGWNPKDNIAYPVSFWLRIGGDIASALKTYTGALYDASPFNAVKEAVKATAEEVVTPSMWPTWLKGGVGVVVAIGAVIVIVNVAAIVRGLKGGAQ